MRDEPPPTLTLALPGAAVAFALGIVLGGWHVVGAGTWSAATALWIGLAWRSRAESRACLVGVLAAFVAVGAVRGTSIPTESEIEAPLERWLDTDVVLVGRLETLPDGLGDESRFTLVAELLRDEAGWHSIHARIRAVVPLAPRLLRPVRRVMLRGALRPIRDAGNPGELARAKAMHVAGLAATIRARGPEWVAPLANGETSGLALGERLWAWRARTVDLIEDSLPAEHAGVMAALLVGVTGGVGPDLNEIFVRTGTAHVLAVSGLNVALVVLAIHVPLRRLLGRSRWLAEEGRSRGVAAAVAWSVAVAYVFLAGAEPPAVRSLVASTCSLAAVWLGRPGTALASLSLGALGILAVSPEALWSISFQLSFAATAALVVADARWRWSKGFAGGDDLVARLARSASYSVAATGIASWVTLPLIVSTFGRFTLLGLVANPLAVPLLATAAVPIGLAGVGLAFVSERLAGWAFRLAEVPVAAGLGVLRGVASVRGCDGLVARCGAELAIAVTATALVALGVRSRRVRAAAVAFVLASAATVAVGPRLRALVATRASTVFLAVGHGDAAVLQLPHGGTVLVDAGPDPEERSGAGRSIVVPALLALGAKRVDLFVASHLQLDHVGGLASVLDQFEVREIWLPARVPVPRWFAPVLHKARARGAVIRSLDAASESRIASGVTLEVLHPPAHSEPLSANDGSLVLRVSEDGHALLFTGDLERRGEELLAGSGRSARAEALKVPHHGSITSSSFALLRAVEPRLAIVSAPRASSTHPSPEIVERFEALGARVLVTGWDGAIRLRWEKTGLTIGPALSTQRAAPSGSPRAR